MSKRARSIIQFAVLLGVGVCLVWLSLRSVEAKKEEIIDSFKNANYFWMAVSLLISLFGHFLRAYRWNYLLQPLGYKTGLLNANGAVLIGYFANYGLPRMGELTRCTVAARYDKIPFEVALGTVITERIVDLALLIIVFFLTLFAEFNNLIGLANKYVFDPLKGKLHALGNHPAIMVVCVLCVVAGIAAFFVLRKKISALLKGKFGKIIRGFADGVVSVKGMKHKGRFILLSIMIWSTYFYSLYVAFYAFGETSRLGQSECLTLLLFGTFGVIFTPGGLGVYHGLITQLLTGYGIGAATAFAFPWLTWTSQFIMIVVLGFASLVILPIINRNRTHAVS